ATIVQLQYELASEEPNTFDVSVTGGTASANPAVYNSVVTVSASDPENFVAWLENGEVVSYDPNYQFTALYDRTLEASTSGSEAALVTLKQLSLREGTNSYLGQFELPAGYDLVETGVLLSDSDNATLDSLSVQKVKSNALQPVTNEFLRSIPITADN